jgi:hypothetical protein
VLEIRRAEDIGPAFQGTPGPCSGAVRLPRSALFRKPGSCQYLRTRRAITDDVHYTGAG